MGAPVVHFEINTNNAKEAKDFYAELFDWRVMWNDEWGYGLVQTEAGRGVDGGIGQPRDEAFITFYVEVDDLQKYLDKAESLGAKTILPPTEVSGVTTIALFMDPQGNRVGLTQS